MGRFLVLRRAAASFTATALVLGNALPLIGTASAAGFSITKTADETEVAVGGTVTFTITVENDDTQSAEAVINDPVPEHLSFVSGSSGCSYDSNIDEVTCSAETLDPGETKTVNLTFRVLDTVTSCRDIENQANVVDQSGRLSPTPSNTVVIHAGCDLPELTARKTVDDTTAAPGDLLHYEITVENNGDGTALDVNITDAVPDGLLFQANLSDSECSLSLNEVTCNLGNITAGNDKEIDVIFMVDPSLDPNDSLCGGSLKNTATISSENHPVVTAESPETDITCPSADLRATKSVNRTSVDRGQQVEYQIRVVNHGSVPATNVTVTDDVPEGLSFDANDSDTDCDLQGSTVECGPITIAAHDEEVFTLVFTVEAGASCGANIANTAAVDSDSHHLFLTNSVTTRVFCGIADFRAAKRANKTSVEIGDTVTYTIEVENTGDATLRDLAVIDTIPTGLTFVANGSDSRCSLVGATVRCGDDDILVGRNDEYDIVFRVNSNAPCGGRISNKADLIFSGNGNLSGSTNTVLTDVRCESQNVPLTVTKTADRSQAEIGDTVIYTIVVKNTGTTTAMDVEVTDQIIHDLSFVSGQSSSDCELVGDEEIECGKRDIGAGRTESFRIALRLTEHAPCGTTIVNQAEAYGSNTARILSNREEVDVMCEPQVSEADLELIMDGPSQILRGTTIIYNARLINQGPADSLHTYFRGPIPSVQIQDSNSRANLVFNPGLSDPKCRIANGEIECGDGYSINSGASKSINIAFDVPSNAFCAKLILFKGTVSGSLTDPRLSNNNDESSSSVQCANSSQFELVKSGPETARVGDEITYTITVSNNIGRDTTRNRLIDPVPDNTVFVRADDPLCHYEPQTNEVICGEFNLRNREARVFHLTFKILATARCNDVITNIADIWSEDPLGVNPIWSNPVRTRIVCDETNLRIEKDDFLTNIRPGEKITYTIKVTNSSQNDANDVVIVDTLPPNVIFIYANRGGVLTNGSIRWVADVRAGDTETFTVQIQIPATATAGTVIRNKACVPSESLCDEDTTTVIVDVEKTGCIEVIKEAFDINGKLMSTVPQFTFRVDGKTAQNASDGKVKITGITVGENVVNEEMPSGWTLLAVTPSEGRVHVTEGSNCAVVNFKNKQKQPDGSAKFSISKTVDKKTAKSGDSLKYTITVKNTGDANATNVEVTDSIPSGTTFVSASDGGTKSGNTVTWKFNLNKGDSITLTLTVTVDSSVSDGDTIRNTACVTSGNICDDDTTKISKDGSPKFSISKTVDRKTAKASDTLKYTIVVKNTGDADASDVKVTDTIPSHTTFVSADKSGSKSGDTVTWKFDLKKNDSITLTLTVKVDSSVSNGEVIRNTACVTAGNICDDDTTTIDKDTNGNVEITITDKPDPADLCVSDEVVYSIRLSNSSNDSQRVDVEATLDSDMEFESASNDGDERGSRVEWNDISVSGDSTRELKLTVKLDKDLDDGDTVELRAEVKGAGDNSDRETTRIEADCDDRVVPKNPSLSIKKDADKTEALSGDTVNYVITIQNGPKDLPNARLVDQYPSSKLLIQDTGGGTDNGSAIEWSLGTLKANSTTVVRYRARLKSVGAGDSIVNTATVTSGSITLSDSHRITVPRPPQTGGSGFFRSVGKSNGFLRSTGGGNGSESSGVLGIMMLMTLALAGVSAGGFIGRRMFFL